jgi:hypothetical protein
MMKMPELKIGTTIDIIFENEINKSNAQYMKAVVYDYEENNIIISQTSPALNSHFLNRRILVTFLANAEKRVLRYGFPTRLIDSLNNYQISSNKEVEALVLKQLEKPSQVDFRTHFRVKPLLQSSINLFFKEEKINLIAISLIGAKFTYLKSHLFHYGDTVNFKLIIDSTEFEINASVCHLSPPHGFSSNKTLQYVGVKFEHNNRQLDSALSRVIIGIERQMLSEGKIT